MTKMFIGLQIKYPFLLSDLMNFLNSFSKNTQIQNFMKIRPMGAEFFRADGWTDKTNLIVAFRNFANALNPYPANVENTVSS